MDTLSREQVDRLAEDIAFMKKAIEKNTSVLQQIDFAASLRLVCLLGGIAVLVFCGAAFLLDRHFCGFALVPSWIKAVFFCSMAAAFVLLGIMKRSGLLKYGRSATPDFSLFLLLKEYYTHRLWHLFIPTGLVLLFACAYAAGTGNGRFVLPVFSIGVGLLYNCIAALLRLDEFLWSGYWFLAAGCVFMVFNTVPLFLSVAIVFGFGFLCMAAIMYMPHNKRAEE